MNYNTNDVFGVKSSLIKSYIERDKVDKKFNDALNDGNEVIVYGSSKQGKTSLILKHLSGDKYIKVECSPQTQPIDIYKSILRQANISFIDSATETISSEDAAKLGVSFKIKVPFIGEVGANPEISGKDTSSVQTKTSYIEYNLALAQDFSELLNKFKIKKYIILENFHYLSLEVQETLAYDLRVFQDNHIIFVILGIWREANRLVQFNGDLLDRITEVPVEPWENEDLKKVIHKGATLLNVDFTAVEDNIIEIAQDSIGVVQELCKQICLLKNINSTSKTKYEFTIEDLELAIRKKTEDYGVRHIRNIESFVDILRRTSTQSGKPSLAFPYYVVKVFLTIDIKNIEKGLSRATLLEEIRKIHHRPEDLRSSDLGAFLHNLTQHQITKKIQPPFLDYDRGSKVLKIIDSSFYFFLRNCNREEILNDLPNPIEDSTDEQ